MPANSPTEPAPPKRSPSPLTGGTLTLSGNSNNYSGGTTISDGVLSITNTSTTASATGTGAVIVNGGALSGKGYVAGTNALVTVNNGGAVAPGLNTSGNFGAAGKLTLNAGLRLVGGSQLDFDLATTAARHQRSDIHLEFVATRYRPNHCRFQLAWQQPADRHRL